MSVFTIPPLDKQVLLAWKGQLLVIQGTVGAGGKEGGDKSVETMWSLTPTPCPTNVCLRIHLALHSSPLLVEAPLGFFFNIPPCP